MADTADTVSFFKKKGNRAGQRSVRKRSASPPGATSTSSHTFPSASEVSESAVVHKARKVEANPLRQGTTAGKRVRNAYGPTEDDAETRLDMYGDKVGVMQRASGSATDANKNKDDAVRESSLWGLENEGEGGEGREAKKARPDATNDDGLYHGSAAYSNYKPERDDGASSKIKAKGPIRAPANIRSVTVVDYQPDVCKDYKETGYCGFGDTCKFLHDRSDYLAGWQLDALPNSAARALSDPEDEDSDEDDVPFACLICRQPFTDPIVTRCGHYFCSACAIKRYAKTPKCFACGAQTGGLFNAATKILDRMNKKQQSRADARAEKRRAMGYEDEAADQADGELIEGVEVGGADEEDEDDG